MINLPSVEYCFLSSLLEALDWLLLLPTSPNATHWDMYPMAYSLKYCLKNLPNSMSGAFGLYRWQCCLRIRLDLFFKLLRTFSHRMPTADDCN